MWRGARPWSSDWIAARGDVELPRIGLLLAARALGLTFQTAPAAAGDWLRERPTAKHGHVYPSLCCVNRGARVELGETPRLRTNCRPEGITRAPAPPSSAPAARG